MSLTWANLEQLARRSAYARITEILLSMTEQERLAFAPEIEKGVKGLRGDSWWDQGDDPAVGFALAVIACMPTAARAAALLNRRDMRDRWGSVPDRFWRQLTEARDLEWLPDLGVRLAARLPAKEAWAGDWRFVARMLDATPELAPATEGFVRGWLVTLHDSHGKCNPLAGKLRSSPYLDVLLPAVFEIDGLGGALTGGQWTPAGWVAKAPFPEAVVELVTEGRLDRATILAATLDRLVRGDRPAWLRPFTELHDALAPTLDEHTAAAGDYAGLLAGAPSPIAAMAQRSLRAVDDAGRLDVETLLETSGTTLQRTEKGLVKTQLSWLEKVARRQPDRAGEVLETVALAFGHPALEVQERALTLIGRQIRRLDAATVARLADASVVLTGDLPARAAELFGVAAPEAEPEVVALAAPAPAAAMPPPITTAAELATEIVALLHSETSVGWERVMAALVALPADGLSEALQPVLDRHEGDLNNTYWYGTFRRPGHLGDVLRRVMTPGAVIKRPNTIKEPTGPSGVLVLRLQEIADRITVEPTAELLATPTRVDGSLDAAVLLERLARLEAADRKPWPVDFEQALLRVPRETGVDVLTGAAELTSVAGLRFAAWLKEGGLPDPVSTRRVQNAKDGRYGYGGTPPTGRRVVAELEPAGGGDRFPLSDRLFGLTRGPKIEWYSGDFAKPADIAAAALPHHREVLAAWALPTLASVADIDQRGAGKALPLIAECAGPVGPAVALAVAYVLGARDEADRLAAVDAFLILAAGDEVLAVSGEPFGAAVGAEIGDLCADGTLKLTRVLPGLTDAHQGGASHAVWHVLAAALPVLLPVAPRGLPDLLELATLVAGRIGAHDEIPGLAEVAARPGTSRVTKEARRLRTMLAG
ncbi:DUF7824 domain-containing protein [Actinoplanes derwentensis]|uniref:DUF7824 domain-containing protein n=1 Tax=Actinoplanes derwentensis TaxID=113562 RepID=A0A1H1W2A5_9ACTN|nr:DUF6493 family protein [Actinoplanes derwentensis]GID84015.1 hypothetical protein Ade03nite_29390 [Actinoplanes derwentensis]SDS90791.1 hypothetical protein SAMN04489716_1950 [Actinoplanes derwentensis]